MPVSHKTLKVYIKSILTRDRSPLGSAGVTMTKEKMHKLNKKKRLSKISNRTSIKSHLMFFVFFLTGKLSLLESELGPVLH